LTNAAQLRPEFTLRDSIAAHRVYYLVVTLLAIGVRIAFLHWFRQLTPDTFVYGDIAKNWLQHGAYAMTGREGVAPTYIRLPGYPMFLILCWLIAGVEHYNIVLFVQVAADVLTCFVVADLALRASSERAARVAFALTATCIFLANYAVVALAETFAVFATAVALDAALAAMNADERSNGRAAWILCGIALAWGILLRPDGGILLAAILFYTAWWTVRQRIHLRQAISRAILVSLIGLAPLVPWTIRNWRVFHEFQPLTPQYATSPGEYVPRGYIHWVRTWMVDYASVEDIWFQMPGSEVDASLLPSRAFDSAEQRDRTEELLADYNDVKNITPELDARFEQLARERVRDSRLRYYIWLPLLRAADVWLRPRTEMLPLDTRWWNYQDDLHDSLIGTALGVVNLFYIVAGLLAFWRGGPVGYAGLFIIFIALRTCFLGTMPNPEPRYVLECFPALFVFAASALAGAEAPKSQADVPSVELPRAAV
jgi:4-amino-4-deoxy-L-arabinose transferase-like glycosyltransferase